MSRATAIRERLGGFRDRAVTAMRERRPRGRRATAITAGKAILVVAALAVALFVAGTAAAAFYGQYGFHPEENAREWAAREPAFTDGSECQACHGAQWNTHIASGHATVGCETCHGPLRAHAEDPQAVARPETPAEARDGICARCHEATSGRPASQPQVDLAIHYTSGICVGCHDPHSTAARRPTVVSHPLENLPACTVCHNPAGLKKLPAGHEEAPDAVCLGCHAAGASGLTGVISGLTGDLP